MQQLSLLLSLAETRQLLGLSRTTVFRLLKEGRLSSVRVGARHLVTRESIYRLVHPEQPPVTTWISVAKPEHNGGAHVQA